MKILITGGAGYIGSVVTEECITSGHETFVVDNLVKGHREMVHSAARFFENDIADKASITRILDENDIEAVIHMAAYSLVGESMADPSTYYHNNVVAGLELLDAMRATGVSKLIFSSTAAVYGEPKEQPISENALLAPTNTYGETKLAFEKLLMRFDAAYGIKYTTLRYFNAAGASERYGEIHDPETHLIPLILDVAEKRSPHASIFGDDYSTPDGTCIRDYIHVTDLAKAHVLAIEQLGDTSKTYNLGSGGGYSVKEAVEMAAKVTGCEIPVKIVDRRAGDPAVLVASSDRIKAELGWKPELTELSYIIGSAWKWRRTHSRA
ncbi:MAG: UDP-glucose 4-epimerase GalE [Acidobacteriota bacterium]